MDKYPTNSWLETLFYFDSCINTVASQLSHRINRKDAQKLKIQTFLKEKDNTAYYEQFEKFATAWNNIYIIACSILFDVARYQEENYSLWLSRVQIGNAYNVS